MEKKTDKSKSKASDRKVPAKGASSPKAPAKKAPAKASKDKAVKPAAAAKAPAKAASKGAASTKAAAKKAPAPAAKEKAAKAPAKVAAKEKAAMPDAAAPKAPAAKDAAMAPLKAADAPGAPATPAPTKTGETRRKRGDKGKNKGESQGQARVYGLGDTVVYPGKGVVKITGYENHEVDGQRQTFVVLKNQKEPPVKILVPLTKMDKVNLRDIVDAATVREVYGILKEKSNFSESGTWNRRFRDYTEKIKSGDILKLAIVLRDLSRQKLVKEPSFGERKMLDTVSDLLVTELSLAKNCTEEDIQNEFKRIFSRGKTAAVEQDDDDEDEKDEDESSEEEEEEAN